MSRPLEIVIPIAVMVVTAIVVYFYITCGSEKCIPIAQKVLLPRR